MSFKKKNVFICRIKKIDVFMWFKIKRHVYTSVISWCSIHILEQDSNFPPRIRCPDFACEQHHIVWCQCAMTHWRVWTDDSVIFCPNIGTTRSVQAWLQIHWHSLTKILWILVNECQCICTQDNIIKNAVTTALRMERNLNSHQTDIPLNKANVFSESLAPN